LLGSFDRKFKVRAVSGVRALQAGGEGEKWLMKTRLRNATRSLIARGGRKWSLLGSCWGAGGF